MHMMIMTKMHALILIELDLVPMLLHILLFHTPLFHANASY